MRLLVLTGYDDAYSHVGDFGIRNKHRYCELRNYEFSIVRTGFDLSRPASWSKILFIKERLAQYDWIFWTDADSLIMNHEVQLTRFIDTNFNWIWCLDNAGQFFIKNCEWSFQFLDEIWAQSDLTHNIWWENAAICRLKDEPHNPWAKHMKHLSIEHERFNYYVEHYKSGDFLLHFAGQENRAVLMDRFNNMPPLA